MIWYETIVDCGDGSSCVRRFRTLEEALLDNDREADFSGIPPEDPVLVDTESPGFFDEVQEVY